MSGRRAGDYQLGEVRRLLGDGHGAVAAFARARELGTNPQPGEALLRCHMGDRDTGWTDLRLALAGEDRIGRMRLLRAAVEVALARGSLDEAERNCVELESGAEAFATPGFRAWAAHARGAIMVQRGEHAEALEALKSALRDYRVQQLRYETARYTSGWRWRIGRSAMTSWPPPTRQPRRVSTTSRRRTGGDLRLAGPGRPDKTRAGDPDLDCLRGHQPASRRAGLHQREDRREALGQHLRKARRIVAHRGGGVGTRKEPAAVRVHRLHHFAAPRLHGLPDAHGADAA